MRQRCQSGSPFEDDGANQIFYSLDFETFQLWKLLKSIFNIHIWQKVRKCKPTSFTQNANNALKSGFLLPNKRKARSCGKLFRTKEKREKNERDKNENKKKKQKEKKLKQRKKKERKK